MRFGDEEVKNKQHQTKEETEGICHGRLGGKYHFNPINSMMVSSVVSSPELMENSGSKGRTAFQWGGSIFAMSVTLTSSVFINSFNYLFAVELFRLLYFLFAIPIHNAS